ncbi:MAG: hypothetical protein HOL66_09290 [Rhodospirillaceae bacterium]|jgi:hypothetical protein|nr:hypothetical protein [Rhodospirillaceae bacterium]MBT5244429.1 hypothetical protein [Rhodospirillaceae bacterium]MBT5561372.1 hypothetical protein [Rhodospirillaceae bacterium]MBT6242011.1 hypothetical protein [Rhodospirillaceae bacterium]MBT7136713.1 hypothetical protein [Rhodospirillaceae bacterium]
MAYLNKLKLTDTARNRTIDPVMRRREKLIEKLNEQRESAVHSIDNTPYLPTKRAWVTDGVTGERNLIEKPKKVRQWFWEAGGVWLFQIRYGANVLELAKGKPTIEVGDKAKLPDVIELCINAVKDGELDAQLNEMAVQTGAKLRKSKAA